MYVMRVLEMNKEVEMNWGRGRKNVSMKHGLKSPIVELIPFRLLALYN